MKYLVVIDMQNDFICGSLGSDDAKAIVPLVKTKIANHSGGLVYTMDTHDDRYLDTYEGINLPVKHCIRGTRGWELHDDIAPGAERTDIAIFHKETFGSVGLAAFLQNKFREGDVDTIEFVGLCTDICVISNALLVKAFIPEARIVVDATCCAGVTPETHKNALAAMRMCHIKVVGEDV